MVVALAVRDWELPLFLHVLGAMVLVGTLAATASALVVAWRRTANGDALVLTRFSFWTLLVGALPSWLLMRIAAQWVLEDSGFDDDAGWVGVGFATSEGGFLLTVAATALTGVAIRRLRRGASTPLGRIAAVLTLVVLAAYVVAIWAMTTKPD